MGRKRPELERRGAVVSGEVEPSLLVSWFLRARCLPHRRAPSGRHPTAQRRARSSWHDLHSLQQNFELWGPTLQQNFELSGPAAAAMGPAAWWTSASGLDPSGAVVASRDKDG